MWREARAQWGAENSAFTLAEHLGPPRGGRTKGLSQGVVFGLLL